MATRRKTASSSKPAAKKPTRRRKKPAGPAEGWGPAPDRRGLVHYFRAGGALCHRVNLYAAVKLEPAAPPEGACSACQARLDLQAGANG